MNRKELIRRVAEELRNNGKRKPVLFPKRIFHISDDDGYTKDFTVQGTGRGILYTAEDVENIIDMCVEVIEDALRHGETVTVRGFGSLGLRSYKYNKGMYKDATGQFPDTTYVPKFAPGSDLRTCGRLYGLSLQDSVVSRAELPDLDIEFDEDGDA